MDTILLLSIMALSTAFNFIIIIWKYRKHRYTDATLDLCLLAIIGFFFSGSFNALSVGTLTSMLISFYLMFRPVYISQLFSTKEKEEIVEEEGEVVYW